MSEQWLEVTLAVPAERLDKVCDALTANGMTGLVIEEEGDFLRFLEQNRRFWDYVDEELAERMRGASRVKFYVPDNDEGRRQLRKYMTGLEDLEPQTVSLREEDWSTSWQKYYRPIPVGKRLHIVPNWLRAEPVPEGRIPLYLNPGLTFGTGSHPTTQLCLELLEEHIVPGDKVLDLGCGSGILGIAALKLGLGDVIAVDIDPKSADVVRENVELNYTRDETGVYHGLCPDDITVYTGDVLGDKKLFQKLRPGGNQIVLANIVADVIIPLSAMVGELLCPGDGGRFIASGIIDDRAEEVINAVRSNGFDITKRIDRAGWCAFAARRADQFTNSSFFSPDNMV